MCPLRLMVNTGTLQESSPTSLSCFSIASLVTSLLRQEGQYRHLLRILPQRERHDLMLLPMLGEICRAATNITLTPDSTIKALSESISSDLCGFREGVPACFWLEQSVTKLQHGHLDRKQIVCLRKLSFYFLFCCKNRTMNSPDTWVMRHLYHRMIKASDFLPYPRATAHVHKCDRHPSKMIEIPSRIHQLRCRRLPDIRREPGSRDTLCNAMLRSRRNKHQVCQRGGSSSAHSSLAANTTSYV